MANPRMDVTAFGNGRARAPSPPVLPCLERTRLVHLHIPPLELASGRVEGDPTRRPDLDVELIHVSGGAAIYRQHLARLRVASVEAARASDPNASAVVALELGHGVDACRQDVLSGPVVENADVPLRHGPLLPGVEAE